jgi:hypothetical protein
MNFKTLLDNLKTYNIDSLIIGSHALYLLNQKLDLEIEIDIAAKDLDIIVKPDENFARFIMDFDIKQVQRKSKNLTMYKIYNNNLKNIDLILQSNFVHLKIDNILIPKLQYETIKNYCYDGFLYGNNIKYINLEAYYGVIKSSGLTKYKTIIQQILNKYPDIKNRVIA